jgi:type IV secretory pathway component VirB8
MGLFALRLRIVGKFKQQQLRRRRRRRWWWWYSAYIFKGFAMAKQFIVFANS